MSDDLLAEFKHVNLPELKSAYEIYRDIVALREAQLMEGFGDHPTDFEDDMDRIVSGLSGVQYSDDFLDLVSRFSKDIVGVFLADPAFIEARRNFDWDKPQSVEELVSVSQEIISEYLREIPLFSDVTSSISLHFDSENVGSLKPCGTYSFIQGGYVNNFGLSIQADIRMDIGERAQQDLGLSGVLGFLIHENIHNFENIILLLARGRAIDKEYDKDAAIKAIGKATYPSDDWRNKKWALYYRHPSERLARYGQREFQNAWSLRTQKNSLS